MLTPLFPRLFARARRVAKRRPLVNRNPLSAGYRLLLERLESRDLPSTWIGGGYDNICTLHRPTGSDPNAWSNALNWVGGVPGAGDTAAFPARFQITTCGGNPVFAPFDLTANVDRAFTVAAVTTDAAWNGNVNVNNALTISNGLTLNSGAFGGNGALAIAGASRWTAGQLNVGTGGLTNSGTLTIANPSLVDLRGGGAVTNSGTITQTGAGSLRISDGSTLNNTGTYNIQADANILDGFGAGGTFNNPGTILKNQSTGASTITTKLNSSNAITVQTGTLILHTDGGVNTGGTFTVNNNAVLDLTGGGAVIYQGGYTGSGGGTVSLNSGRLVVGPGNATFNFSNGLFVWSGGELNIGGNTLTNPATGFLTFSGPGSNIDDLRGGGTLVNSGRIVHKNAADLRISDGTVLNNQSMATYEFQTNVNILNGFGAGGIVNNAGTILKSGGTGVSTITANLNSSNAVTVQTGTLSLHPAGGTNTGGIFTVAANAILDLTGGAGVTYQGTYTGSGAGMISLNSGTLSVGPGNATFNFPSGLFVWSGGILEVDTGRTLTNATTGFLTLSGSSSSIDDLRFGGTLINNGRIIHKNAADLRISDGTVFNNQAGATYELQTDVNILDGFGAGGIVNNAGTILKSATTGSGPSLITANLNNRTTIDVEAGTLQLRTVGGINTGGNFIVGSPSAVLDLTGGNTVAYTGTYTGSGPGTVRLNNGTLSVVSVTGSTGATFNFPAGLFQWNGGILSTTPDAPLTNANTLTLAGGEVEDLRFGGTLTNNGTIIQTGAGDLRISDGTTLINNGTYNFQANSNILNGFGVGGIVNNPGTILKTNTASVSVITANLNNSAIIDVESGTLQLRTAGGVNTGGAFAVAASAVLDLTGGTNVTYQGSYTGSGAGAIALNSGVLTIGAANATFHFPAGMFLWSGGELNIAGGRTLTIDTDGALTLSGASGGVEESRGGGTLVNNGAITQTGLAPWRISDGTVLNNNGVYNFQADANILNGFGVGGIVNNPGTILKTDTAGTSIITANFNNSATIDVESGTIVLQTAGGVNTGGNLIVAGGAVLDLTGGNSVTYVGSYTGFGDGTVVLTAGNLVIGAANADFNLPAGMFVWSGGILQANGNTMTIDAAGALTLSGASALDLRGAGQLINAGVITQVGAGDLRISDGSRLINQASGLYDIEADSGILNGFGAGGSFLNNGTFQKSAGAGTSTVSVPFTNADTPDNPNSDLVLALSGTLNFTNSYTQTAGDTNLGGGSLMAGTLNIQGGVLDGAGDVFGSVINAGTVSPGGDGTVGVLTIHGNYTQTATGMLNIDIQDALPGDFDQLIVTGAASLGGTLNVSVLGTVNPGDRFLFLTFASRSGDFAAPPPGFTEVLNANDMTLVAQ